MRAETVIEMGGPATPPEILLPDLDGGLPKGETGIVIHLAFGDQLLDAHLQGEAVFVEESASTDDKHEQEEGGEAQPGAKQEHSQKPKQSKAGGDPRATGNRDADPGQDYQGSVTEKNLNERLGPTQQRISQS